jgi:hypothetical protein
MSEDDKTESEGPRALEEFLERFKPPSGVQKRLLDLPPPDADEAILYQHSVLCQTCLPTTLETKKK